MFSDSLREDLLVTALEGGSNYWYMIYDISEIDESTEKNLPLSQALWDFVQKGGSLIIHDVEEPDQELGEFNLKSIERGEEILRDNYSDIYKDIDDDNWDADHADAWFQCAVLQGIEFG